MARYDLAVERVELLGHWNNTTFAVWGRREGRAGRFMLRVSRPAFQTRPELESECALLDHMRRSGGLVPEPLAAADGPRVVSATASGVPQARDCTLFGWLPGRFLYKGFKAAHAERAGVFLAWLHGVAAAFSPPLDFGRKRWDAAAFFGAAAGIDAAGVRPFLRRGDRELLARLQRRLRRLEERWAQDPVCWGLIHGDPHPGNLLFGAKGAVGAIDFDECGWGFYAYDLAVCLAELRGRPDRPSLERALLAGYSRRHPLPDSMRAALPTLVAARLWGMAVWTAGVADHPGNRASAPRLVRATLDELPRWLDGAGRAE